MKTALFGLMMINSAAAWATTQTVTLELPTMNCALCPVTIEKALEKVDGVAEITISLADKQATITYDDAITSTEKLITATKNAGFPSSIKSNE